MVQHEQRLNVHAENAILVILALNGAEQVDFALFKASQHDRRNRNVGGLFDVTRGIVVSTATVKNDNFLLCWTVAVATSKLRDETIFVDEFDFCVGHFLHRFYFFRKRGGEGQIFSQVYFTCNRHAMH